MMKIKHTILEDIDGYSAWIAVARTCLLSQRQLAAVLDPFKLEVAHYDVLANIFRDEGLTQQVLARRLLVAKSNVSALLSVLERRGLIERAKHRSDARVRLVSLTPEGRRVTHKAMKAHALIMSPMLAVVSSAEADAVRQVMAKIAAVLEQPETMRVQRDDAA